MCVEGRVGDENARFVLEILYTKRACTREAWQDLKQARQLASLRKACGMAASQQAV